jgi:Glycosyl hydrolase family 26
VRVIAHVCARRGSQRAKPRSGGVPRRIYALALTIAAVAFAAPSAAQAAAPQDTLGIYPGSGNVARLTSFQQTLGRNLAHVHDYLDKRTWATMLDMQWMAQRWSGAGFANKIVITVPMLPDSVPAGYGGLASGAAGTFNPYFKTLAEHLVAYGMPNAILRIGPEFNGNWFRWTMKVDNGAADFAAYWRQIVNTMRTVPGQHFKFDWAANAGSSYTGPGQQLEAADAWPGDAYVDYVGMDVYDQSWAPWQDDPVARWNEYVNQHNGMAWQVAFAAAHGKPLSYPEWGLVDRADGHGGGDDPYFIQQMYDWFATHNVAYTLYFEDSDPNAQYAVFSGNFPTAAQKFISLFGAPPPPPPPPPTSPPPPPAPPGGGHDPKPGRQVDADGSSFDLGEFARLCINSARISPGSRRLTLLATITRHASGAAKVQLLAGGRKTRFSKKIKSGRVKVSRKLSSKQARKGTGIVTISYGGNAKTRPQTVRLRLAPRAARLHLGVAPTLSGGRLKSFGTISKRARGVVRLQMTYEVNAQTVTREYKAKIRKGRWQLNATLTQLVQDEIAGREGPVHAYALYTGSLPRRIGGQMKSYELLGPR